MMKLLAVLAVLCTLLLSTMSQSDAPYQGLMVYIESKTTEEGLKIPAAMDAFVMACAYGVPKIDSTSDSLKHWYAVITTPLQLQKKECASDTVKVAVGTNGVVKKFVFDKSWSYDACTSQTDLGPAIACDTKQKKCDKSVLCSDSFTVSYIVAFVAVVMAVFA